MMKMKILPPTLREKKRYIGFKLYSQEKINKDEIIIILWNNLINVYGEIESSKINLWLIDYQNVKNNIRYEYNCIVKCQRGYEKKAIIALNTITRHKQNKIVIHVLGVSGTINSLKKKYALQKK